jgi:hypothetical protein
MVDRCRPALNGTAFMGMAVVGKPGLFEAAGGDFVATYHLDRAEERIRALEAELAILKRSREQERDYANVCYENEQLKSALREIAIGLLPEDRTTGDGRMYMLCASRLCGIARDAIRTPKTP